MAYLASEAATTLQTSAATPYTGKVLQALARAEIVVSLREQRAVVGPAELTILDVVNVVDPIQRIRSCSLHARMDRALSGVERVFQEALLAEILAESTSSTRLCESVTRGRISDHNSAGYLNVNGKFTERRNSPSDWLPSPPTPVTYPIET